MINAAVLGSPIKHSLSPLLHSLAYEHLGLDGSYEAIEVGSGQLASFLERTEKNCLSLTMPLKEEALSLASEISSISASVSSGNTLTVKEGKWSLTSTDVAGFEHALKYNKVEGVNSVVVLGAGATARAAVACLSTIAKEINVVSRNQAREEAMNRASFIELNYLPWGLTDKINSADLIINTTPLNTAEYFLPSISAPKGVLLEVLYEPWPTLLSEVWAESGAQVIDGLELLIHQAISQVEVFSNGVVDRKELHQLMRTAAVLKLG